MKVCSEQSIQVFKVCSPWASFSDKASAGSLSVPLKEGFMMLPLTFVLAVLHTEYYGVVLD